MNKLILKITDGDGFPVSGVFFEIDGYKKAVSDKCGEVSIPYESLSEKVVINWPRQHFQFTTIGKLAYLEDNTLVSGREINEQSVIEEAPEQSTVESECVDYEKEKTINGEAYSTKSAGFIWPLITLLGFGVFLSKNKNKKKNERN